LSHSSSPFCLVILEMRGSHELFALLQTTILLILASQIAVTTGVSHWCLTNEEILVFMYVFIHSKLFTEPLRYARKRSRCWEYRGSLYLHGLYVQVIHSRNIYGALSFYTSPVVCWHWFVSTNCMHFFLIPHSVVVC
jgi:hypothetical protein